MRLHPEKERPDWQVFLPNAAKFLRLGFHDCLTTEGGGGGCNGCLNPTGMRMNMEPPSKQVMNTFACIRFLTLSQRLPYEADGFTTNNGLGQTVDLLEEIYTNRKFPVNTPELSISLAESGKSR